MPVKDLNLASKLSSARIESLSLVCMDIETVGDAQACASARLCLDLSLDPPCKQSHGGQRAVVQGRACLTH